MKKSTVLLLAIVIIVIMSILFTAFSCNKQVIDLNYNFTRAYVKVGETWIDIEISKWTDFEDGEQLQLTLKDGTVMLVSSINCILYNGTLPHEN